LAIAILAIALTITVAYILKLVRRLACSTYCWTKMSEWALDELQYSGSAEDRATIEAEWKRNVEQHLGVMRRLGVWRPSASEIEQFDGLLKDKYGMEPVEPQCK
jgi:hypothetical protein